jgi:thiol-disulfide isomerase/thioredoxin
VSHASLAGLLVALGALALGTVFGLWHRKRDGRLRPVADQKPIGSVEQVGPVGSVGQVDQADEDTATLERLGVRPGRVTLLQFSSEYCAPCRAAHATCTAVAGERGGVNYVEVDAAGHLEEVRQLGIWRTPTVLVIDPAGRIAHRASGAPARSELAAIVDGLFPERTHAA